MTIEVRASKLLFYLLSGTHILALAAILCSALIASIMILIIILLSISLMVCYYASGTLKNSSFIQRIACSVEGQWLLERTDGHQQAALLCGHYWHPYLLLLNFSTGRWRRCSVVLLADSAAPDQLRRLRVQLAHTQQSD